MSAFEILQKLQSEVGSRRAGSAGERRAQAWLQAQCQSIGLAVELDEFTYIGSEFYIPVIILAAITWIAIVSSLGRSPAGNVLFGLGIIYIAFIHTRLEVRLAQTRSYNIVAGLRRTFSEYAADPNKGPAFLICAHYDTARSLPAIYPKLRNLTLHYLFPLAIFHLVSWISPAVLGLSLVPVILGLCAFGLAAHGLGLAWLAGLAGWLEMTARAIAVFLLNITLWFDPWWTVWGGMAIATPIAVIMLLYVVYELAGKKTDSPGADDNGSGIALALELARRLKQSPPTNAEVFFAWWGAEERGLFGSRQFVRRFDAQLDQARFCLINADCIGVGESLTVLTGQGLVRRRHTNPALGEQIERIAAGMGVKTVRLWEAFIGSDHHEWLNRGYRNVVWLMRDTFTLPPLPFRALTALARLPIKAPGLSHIHSPRDTLEIINPKVLEETTDIAEIFARNWPPSCCSTKR